MQYARRVHSRSFQRTGPALLNALSPQRCLVRGTVSYMLSADLRERVGTWRSSMPAKYPGDRPFSARKTWCRTSYCIRNSTGSQWSSMRIGVMRQVFFWQVTIRAAMFWQRWILATRRWGNGTRRALLNPVCILQRESAAGSLAQTK